MDSSSVYHILRLLVTPAASRAGCFSALSCTNAVLALALFPLPSLNSKYFKEVKFFFQLFSKRAISSMLTRERGGREVAGMCAFLALDPACNYVTGHSFNVDGGIAIGQ